MSLLSEMAIKYFLYLAEMSERYGVSFQIFVIIYLIMTPTYYYGAYLIGHDVFSFRKKFKSIGEGFNRSLHDLFLRKRFLAGYAINRVSWVAPYIYVILFGDNLPKRVVFLIIGWLVASMYIFAHNVKRRYNGVVV